MPIFKEHFCSNLLVFLIYLKGLGLNSDYTVDVYLKRATVVYIQ